MAGYIILGKSHVPFTSEELAIIKQQEIENYITTIANLNNKLHRVARLPNSDDKEQIRSILYSYISYIFIYLV